MYSNKCLHAYWVCHSLTRTTPEGTYWGSKVMCILMSNATRTAEFRREQWRSKRGGFWGSSPPFVIQTNLCRQFACRYIRVANFEVYKSGPERLASFGDLVYIHNVYAWMFASGCFREILPRLGNELSRYFYYSASITMSKCGGATVLACVRCFDCNIP